MKLITIYLPKAKNFTFVLDNGYWQTALSKDISNFSFEYFDNWIMGDTN